MKYLKKLSIIILLTVLSISVNAQEHFKFLGISISGTFTDIKPKLESAGFEFVGKEQGYDMYSFIGSFIGKVTKISVSLTPISKQVMSISCSFKGHSTLEEASLEYIDIVKSLNAKYGASVRSKDLANDIVSQSAWNIETAYITAIIYGERKCTLLYMDRINGILFNKEMETINQSQL